MFASQYVCSVFENSSVAVVQSSLRYRCKAASLPRTASLKRCSIRSYSNLCFSTLTRLSSVKSLAAYVLYSNRAFIHFRKKSSSSSVSLVWRQMISVGFISIVSIVVDTANRGGLDDGSSWMLLFCRCCGCQHKGIVVYKQ